MSEKFEGTCPLLPMKTQFAKQLKGFTLVELAVVLVLIGIVMTMGLKMVTATLENASYSETKAKQELIKTALIGFLRTNGRLPCPDNTGSAAVASGVEVSPCQATAADGYGVVPWVTLGIPRDSVVDGWGNYFTYRVANGTGGSKNWTSKTAGNPFDINELRTPTSALSIQELDAAGTALVTTNPRAVVVLLSHGKNGFGAKSTKVGARLPTTDAGAGEATNATDTTTIFILRPVNESTGAFNGPYDDLLTYLTPQDLLQPLLNEGSLRSCYAYCPSTPTCTGGGTFSCTAGGGFCNGTVVSCTASGTPACSSGIPQCVLPGPLCSATAIPVGLTNTTCS